jgi:methionyl-tRNA formyltransferase
LRTVYLGTSAFASSVLRRLAESSHRPTLVVTPPDSRRGRGRKTQPPPVAQAARDLALDLIQVESVNADDARERIAAAAPDIGAICAFGQLIREPLLSELELLNVHPSLLPRWRGAAPIERAILAGDGRTGVAIMRLTAGLDSGPVALAQEVEIGARDFGELSAELANMGGELLVRALDLRARGELEFRDQDDAQATYAEKIEAGERRLDPGASAVELERRVRALSPHVGAYLELAGGERLGVTRGHVGEGEIAAGELVVGDGELLLGCADGVLAITRVKAAGKREMDAADFLRGHEPPRLA